MGKPHGFVGKEFSPAPPHESFIWGATSDWLALSQEIISVSDRVFSTRRIVICVWVVRALLLELKMTPFFPHGVILLQMFFPQTHSSWTKRVETRSSCESCDSISAIVYSEVRGKTGRKILKIYFSLSVSWVSRALSLLLLYTSAKTAKESSRNFLFFQKRNSCWTTIISTTFLPVFLFLVRSFLKLPVSLLFLRLPKFASRRCKTARGMAWFTLLLLLFPLQFYMVTLCSKVKCSVMSVLFRKSKWHWIFVLLSSSLY